MTLPQLDLSHISDNDHLLDLLIQCEDVLDSSDLYCYKNWFDGEIVEGPIVRRHWITISLLYAYDKMPDPRAALRLLKHGVQVEFERMQRAADPTNEAEDDPLPGEWLVRLSFPRRLLDQNEETDLAYEDDVDPDDVDSAKDSGIDDESALKADEQLPSSDPNDPNNPMAAPPPAPPPQ